MNLINKYSILLLFFVPIISLGITRPPPVAPKPETHTGFIIMENLFILDNTNVKSAIPLVDANGIYHGLELQLKSFAAKEFEQITGAAVGKNIAMVLNNRVLMVSTIQTSLGKKFILSSITKEDALAFVNQLRAHQTHKAVPVVQ